MWYLVEVFTSIFIVSDILVTSMTDQEPTFQSTAGWTLPYLLKPAASDSPKGVFLIHHGICDHCRCFSYLFDRLSEAGFTCYCFDAHSHGKSTHPDICHKTLVAKWEHLVDDMVDFFNKVLY